MSTRWGMQGVFLYKSPSSDGLVARLFELGTTLQRTMAYPSIVLKGPQAGIRLLPH